jgi:hypothetical protein
MKLKLNRLNLLGLLLLLVFSACRKDPDPVVTPPVIMEVEWEPRIENITASLQGHVVNQNNEAVIDATVKLNGNTSTTNEFGHFFFTDIEMNSKGAYVTIEKEGFFLGSRRFFPQENSKNRIKVEMLPQDFSTEFDAATGGSYAFDNTDVQLIFPANAIKNEATGEAYTGTVFVAAQYLDPNASNTFDQMPGNLQGINAESQEGALKTLGMMAVELQGAAGEKLNIAEGQTATVSIPAPAGIDNLPAEVPLWSFDEEIGLWIEEGIATLENGVYTGEVSHFSFWNWDIYAPSADFFAILTDADGNPIPNLQVSIISGSMGAGYGHTDETGLVGGMVPADEVLTIKLYSQCNSIIFTQEIGPFAEGTETMENITVDISTINSTTVTGQVRDCNGVIVVNSLVTIDYDGGPTQYFYTDATGAFDNSITLCDSPISATLTAVDLTNLVQSNEVALAIDADNAVGSITACDIVIEEDFFILTFNGVTQIYSVSNDISSAQHFRIIKSVDNVHIVIGFEGLEAGDYDGNLNYNSGIHDNYLGWSFSQINNDSGFENFNVSVFTNDNVSGTFSGNVMNNKTGIPAFVEGSFSVNPN